VPEQPAAARHISWPAEDFGQARLRWPSRAPGLGDVNASRSRRLMRRLRGRGAAASARSPTKPGLTVPIGTGTASWPGSLPGLLRPISAWSSSHLHIPAGCSV